MKFDNSLVYQDEGSKWLNEFVQETAQENSKFKAFPKEAFSASGSLESNLDDEVRSYVYQDLDNGGMESLPRIHFHERTLNFMAQYVDPKSGELSERGVELYDVEHHKYVVNDTAIGLCENYPMYESTNPEKQELIETGKFIPTEYHLTEAINDYFSISKELAAHAIETTLENRYDNLYSYFSRSDDIKLPSELTNNVDEHGYSTYYRDRLEQSTKDDDELDINKALNAIHLSDARYGNLIDNIRDVFETAQNELSDDKYNAHLVILPDFDKILNDEYDDQRERHMFKFLAEAFDKAEMPPKFLEEYLGKYLGNESTRIDERSTMNYLSDSVKTFFKEEIPFKEQDIRQSIKPEDVVHAIKDIISNKGQEISNNLNKDQTKASALDR